ncbi:ABC transporter ATP-binding protein [Gordonia westfalica]|uniref:ATP-binding cassette, subfamily B n=1 Tax=Gordonia westfalica TaxID=158898 RepID=A0A1H2LKD6_9ACTN|nr:ABC transporter ATP-binding protein [Gordonia westfalica]SDU81513.1 ATP-binding cassette, subfamily B [Gordonia westfalica]
MIRGFYTILGSERARMVVFLSWVFLYGVAQGLAMLTLVPISENLLTGDYSGAAKWLWPLGILVAICAVSAYIQSLKGMTMALYAMRMLHHRLGDHMVTLPLGWFTRERIGDVSQIAVKGTMFVGSTGAHYITPVVVNTVSSVVVVLGICFFDWRIGLLMVAGTLVLMYVGKLSSKFLAKAEGRKRAEAVKVNNRVLEYARCQAVLRAFGDADSAHAPLADALKDQARVGKAMLWRSILGILLNGLSVQVVFSAVLAFGAWLAVSGNVEPALLIAVFGLAARFFGPIGELAELGSTLRMSTDEINRITGVLDTDRMPAPAEPKPIAEPGAVELSKVAFGYENGTPVLREVSLRAQPGTMTALVGPSGSGKSTIFRLIARFYDVDGGVVKVGGVDVRDQETGQLMGQLSQVFQDVYLFDDTLWENIKLGRPDATDAEIRAAAGTAGVTSIVERLPDGWDTVVGEGGSALSGGERQRVSIARALLKDAPIVLFDEATSALDPENEAHVAESIRRLSDRSTVLVIAHKLSTVVAADQIVVLDDQGGVDDIGTHNELIARGGRYTEFWQQRTAAAGWTLAASS